MVNRSPEGWLVTQLRLESKEPVIVVSIYHLFSICYAFVTVIYTYIFITFASHTYKIEGSCPHVLVRIS